MDGHNRVSAAKYVANKAIVVFMQKKWVTNKVIMINPNGEILLIRETKNGKVRWWELPGGRMDVEESPLETLKRELKEEIGIDVDVSNARPFHIDHWGLKNDPVNNPIVGIFYILSATGNEEIDFSINHDQYVWVDPKGKMPEPLSEVTKRAISYLGKHGTI